MHSTYIDSAVVKMTFTEVVFNINTYMMTISLDPNGIYTFFCLQYNRKYLFRIIFFVFHLKSAENLQHSGAADSVWAIVHINNDTFPKLKQSSMHDK